MSAADEIERLTERVRVLEGALRGLTNKLTVIGADSSFIGIWGFLHVHGYKYTGPNWWEELDDARAALATATPKI